MWQWTRRGLYISTKAVNEMPYSEGVDPSGTDIGCFSPVFFVLSRTMIIRPVHTAVSATKQSLCSSHTTKDLFDVLPPALDCARLSHQRSTLHRRRFPNNVQQWKLASAKKCSSILGNSADFQAISKSQVFKRRCVTRTMRHTYISKHRFYSTTLTHSELKKQTDTNSK